MLKVLVGEFKTNNITQAVEWAKNGADLEVGVIYHAVNEKKGTVEAQYFLDEELSKNKGIVDLLAKNYEINLLGIQQKGIISNFTGVYIHELSREDFEKLILGKK